MPSTKTTLMAAAMAFAITANAHMKLATPTPYGKSSLTNSPLDASGKDFPCKQRPGVYDAEGASNIMPIGVNQTLSFIGSAVHGGGSCQISLTKDKQPSKNSKWMVIHSIEGGCPASAAGNLGEDPSGSGAAKFEYSIPEGIAPGDYSLAWTWFNKIGNREMYMNCAPVTVTGGSKKREEIEITTKRDTSFPDMFVANIPIDDCKTDDGVDLKFPNPGSSVQEQSPKMVPPIGPKCGAASGGPSSSGPSGSSSGASAPQPSSSGGVFAAGAASPSGSSQAPSSVPAVAPPVASPAPSAAPAPAVAPGNTSSSSSGSSGSSGSAPAAASAPAPASGGSAPAPVAGAAGSASCSAPGTEVCSPDGTQIGMCDTTSHVVFGPVAAGTKCVGGQMVVAKRSAKFVGRDRVRRGGSAAPWGFSYNN